MSKHIHSSVGCLSSIEIGTQMSDDTFPSLLGFLTDERCQLWSDFRLKLDEINVLLDQASGRSNSFLPTVVKINGVGQTRQAC